MLSALYMLIFIDLIKKWDRMKAEIEQKYLLEGANHSGLVPNELRDSKICIFFMLKSL
jgi:hypothetical protein